MPEHWTAETLFEKHVSEPPNPDIAHAFYLAGYIESWGQGINKICKACIAEGIDLPVFDVHPNDIMVTLKTTEKKVKGLDGYVSSTISGRSSGRNEDLATLVLELISNNPSITQQQITEQANLTRGQVAYSIAKHKDSGQIIRVGSTKSGHWSVLKTVKKSR